uniref:Uncharacterized protein n=1 Tax=Cacopsylla melanoneura TaxID=428564 RepID=A0A8D8WET1_9HEMI
MDTGVRKISRKLTTEPKTQEHAPQKTWELILRSRKSSPDFMLDIVLKKNRENEIPIMIICFAQNTRRTSFKYFERFIKFAHACFLIQPATCAYVIESLYHRGK